MASGKTDYLRNKPGTNDWSVRSDIHQRCEKAHVRFKAQMTGRRNGGGAFARPDEVGARIRGMTWPD
ncbi:hypothetical protein GGD83_003749 [Rhodoblastus sphagnicola]|nr:hypothetical protein [Rhodoblastus sphagnicola]